MAYDGLVNYSVVKELNKYIVNGKIDKIFEPNYEEILLGIYCNGTKYSLSLVTNSKYYRANLTTNAKPNPTFAPNFCMTLRKYLLGTHITKIYTNSLERIIFIEFEGYNKIKDSSVKKLIIELMGKHSNIILVDSENIIIDSLKHFSISSGSYRNIFAGSKYEFPKDDKIDFTNIQNSEEFYRVLQNNAKKLNTTSISKIVSNTFTGISKNSILAYESCNNISDELTQTSSNAIFEYIKNVIECNNIVCESYESYYYISSCSSNSAEKENNLQINFFLDDFYTAKEENTTFITYRDNLLKLILTKLNKLNSKLENINQKIQECKDAEKYKLYGELITSNLYKIDDYHKDSIILENYYDNNSLIEIKLDSSITPSENAKRFFKKYKKLKSAKQFVDVQKAELTNNINYLESIVYEISTAKTVVDIDDIYSEIHDNLDVHKSPSEKQNKYGNVYSSNRNLEKYNNKLYSKNKKQNKSTVNNGNSFKQNSTDTPLKFEVDGFTVLVGKNNKQNDYITTKLANDDDIWLHVKDFHGSHVILRTDNKEPSQDTINKCAELAKKYSKASESSNIMVDYTYVKYVKKPSGSKPGMVIYTNNKTVIVK